MWLRRVGMVARGVLAILGLMVLVLWVRSYQAGDAICYFGPPRGFELLSRRGDLGLYLYSGFENVRTPWLWKRSGSSQRYSIDTEHAYNGQHAGREFGPVLGIILIKGGTYYRNPIGDTTAHVEWHEFGAPHWMVAAAMLAWPVYCAAIPWRRRLVVERRRAAGLCLNCGYDLRGGGARCPECGSPSMVGPPQSEIHSPLTPLSPSGEREL